MYNQNMTFEQVALQDYPVALWSLDGPPPYVDLSGNGYQIVTPSVTNLIPNPSFETNSTGWSAVNGAITTTSAQAYSGTKSLQVTANSSGLVYVWPVPYITVTAGVTYSASGYVRSGTTARNTRIAMQWYNVSNGIISTVNGTLISGSTTDWIRIVFTGEAPAGAVAARVLFYVSGQSATAADVFYLDAVTMEEGSTVSPYFDGASAGATWGGTAHASTSNLPTTPAYHAALTKGALKSLVISNAYKPVVDAPVMKRGKEHMPFTIEVTVRPIRRDTSLAQQQIFGTASAMDGIVLAGTVLSFTTKYTTAGEARCEFDLEEYRAVTIGAVHTLTKNSLFVNGELVDEVDITPEQQADTYLYAGTSLTMGTTTSTNALAVSGLAIFPHALEEGDLEEHYDEVSDNMDEYAVGASFKAATFALNSSTSIPVLEYRYSQDEHFMAGRFSGTVLSYGQVVPQAIDGVSKAGYWECAIPLPPSSTLSSITMDWQGQGETVQTSLDGINWQTEKRTSRIGTVTDGFSTSNKSLIVRVSFAGGVLEDRAYFDDFMVNIYGPSPAPTLESRAVTLSNVSIEADYDITEYHENWGLELDNGTLTIGATSASTMTPHTIQVWAKKEAAASFTDNLAATATNWYTNDGTYQQAYQVDEWQLRTYTYNGGYSGAITFSGTGQIGCVLIYPYVLTAAQVKDTYLSFTGTKSTRFSTTATIGVTDMSSAVEIYEYNWGIESAG